MAFTRTLSAEGWDVYVGSDGAVLVALLLKQPGVDAAQLGRLPLPTDRAVAERARLIDLATGGVSETKVRRAATVDSTALDATPPLACATPALLLVPLQRGLEGTGGGPYHAHQTPGRERDHPDQQGEVS